MNPRTCVVTGEERSPDAMIRFVTGPDDHVVPDIKRKLPGRGVWVTNGKTVLEQALSKGRFARGFKRQVHTDKDLLDTVERLLERDCLELLALARKAGSAISGFAKVESAVRSGQAVAVVHASEAAGDGRAKIAQAARVSGLDELNVIEEFEGEKLDRVTGSANTTHIALLGGGLSNRLVAAASRLEDFRRN